MADSFENSADTGVNVGGDAAAQEAFKTCVDALGVSDASVDATFVDADGWPDLGEATAPQGVVELGEVFGKAAYKLESLDAIFIGVSDSGVLDHPVVVALAGKRSSMDWKTTAGTVGSLGGCCASFNRNDDKDSLAITNGPMSTPERRKDSATGHTIISFDDDSGQGIWKIAAAIAMQGWQAIIFNTHSHLKKRTIVREKPLMTWLRSTGRDPGHPENITVEHIRLYLTEKREIRADLVANATILEKREYARDTKSNLPKYEFIVEHEPVPRTRVILFLDKPHAFPTETAPREKAYGDWGGLYGGIIALTGIPFDQSCASIERLNYLPNIPHKARVSFGLDEAAAAGAYQIIILAGDLVRTDAIERVATFSSTINDRVYRGRRERKGKAGAPRVGFKTLYLEEAVRAAGQSLRALDLLKAVYGDHIVKQEHPNRDGANVCCPNGAEHSDFDDPTDPDNENKNQGSMAINGDPEADQWPVIYCPHAGCSDEAADENGKQNWRYFLDLALQHAGWDASAIFEYCGGGVAELRAKFAAKVAWIKAEELGADIEALKAAIEAMSETSPQSEIDAIIAALGTCPDNVETIKLSDRAAERVGVKPPDMKRFVMVARNDWHESKENDASFGRAEGNKRQKEDPRAPEIPIYLPPMILVQTVTNALHDLNNRDLRLFTREEGGTVRLERAGSRHAVKEMDKDTWFAELVEQLEFIKIFRRKGKVVKIPVWPEKKFADYLLGTTRLPWPVFDQMVTVPVFSPDGHLQTRAGYDPNTRCYLDLDPDFKLRDAPKVGEVTDKQVQEAVWWLEEATFDLPFSDIFDGSETLPVYERNEAGYVRDEDDHLVPNWERGRSSRANLYALILQQFVRSMIKGPCPAYVFDKPIHGTGATYLADVPGMIFLGRRMPGQTMGHDPREVRQSMGSTLRTGAPYMFLDNINMHVDNGDLAAGLTVGELVTRILGKTEMVTIQVRAAVMFAGNNLTFSQELMRRLIPIRLDRGMENPAKDWNEFKYQFHDFLEKHRADLIWAVHVLVLNWIQKGRPAKSGGTTMGSFEEWERVLGGILESAGVEGFLVNRDAYLAAKGEEAASDKELVTAVYRRHKSGEFTAREVYNIVSMTFDDFGYLNLDPFKESKAVMQLGRHLSRHVEGRSFKIEIGGGIQGSVSANGVAKPNPTGNPTGGGKEILEVRFTCPHTVSPKRWKIVPSGT